MRTRQLSPLALLTVAAITMAYACHGYETNRHLRKRRPSAIQDSNKQQVVIRSEAFLLDLGNGAIPSNDALMQALHQTFEALHDATSMQDASVIDVFDVGRHHYSVVCITILGSTSLAASLNNRSLRRRREDKRPNEIVELVAPKVDEFENIPETVAPLNVDAHSVLSLMNDNLPQQGDYQIHVMLEVPKSICAAADMIPAPPRQTQVPSALSTTLVQPSSVPSRSFSASPSATTSSLPTFISSMVPTEALSAPPSSRSTIKSFPPSYDTSFSPSSKPTMEKEVSPVSSVPIHVPSAPQFNRRQPTVVSLSPASTSTSPTSASLDMSLSPSVNHSMQPSVLDDPAVSTEEPSSTTLVPISDSTLNPSLEPSSLPLLRSSRPSLATSISPSVVSSPKPTMSRLTPLNSVSLIPSSTPMVPTRSLPSFAHSLNPTKLLSNSPSFASSFNPAAGPSNSPSTLPSISVSATPSISPHSMSPSQEIMFVLSKVPSVSPSNEASLSTSLEPSSNPTMLQSGVSPTISRSPVPFPSSHPSLRPSGTTSPAPSVVPSNPPSIPPSILLSSSPSVSLDPSFQPSNLSFQSLQPISANSSVVPTVVFTCPPTTSPSRISIWIPSTPPSTYPTASQLPSIIPTTSPSQSYSPSISQSPTQSPSIPPSLSKQPSDRPSVSTSPSLPPPDWHQYGSTILGGNMRRISLSNDGHTFAAVFLECHDGTDADTRPCARVYEYKTAIINNIKATDWFQVGSDLHATVDNSTVNSVSVSGDASTVAIGMVSTSIDDAESQEFFLQAFSVSSEWRSIGGIFTEALPFSNTFETRTSLSYDGSLMSFGVSTQADTGHFLLQTYQLVIDNNQELWQRFGSALSVNVSAVPEISGGGRTVALMDTNPSLLYHLTADGSWESRTEGLPVDYYYRMSLNDDGMVLATRQLVKDGLVDIFTFENGQWEQTGTVRTDQVYESNFGYQLDLSADGRTVAIATFHSDTASISCTQAFQQLDEETKEWPPMGRPACGDFVYGHSGFGTYLTLSGNGLLMTVGDHGNFNNRRDNGHIHSYVYVPRGEG